jgi:hypothetical protein
VKGQVIRIAIATFVLVNLALVSLVVFHCGLDFTSANSAFYVVRDRYGGYDVKKDFALEEADRVVLAVNLNNLFHRFMRGLAVAKDGAVLELTWDADVGVGGVKQYRADGSILSMSFSRFWGRDGQPHGVFLGGDLPFEDRTRSRNQDSSGLAYFDGAHWNHMWCTTNEHFNLLGERMLSAPPVRWDYLGSRVLKESGREVVLESDHALRKAGADLRMKRIAQIRAGEDYFILRLKFTNEGDRPVTYSYSWGDEPWVGSYGSSEGDVGWHAGGPVWAERLLSPASTSYAGYWDRGNQVAGERDVYTGQANFVRWFPPQPSAVYFANSFGDCCDASLPLASPDERVVNLLWMNQLLLPGESRTYTLAVGMPATEPGSVLPRAPEVSLN